MKDLVCWLFDMNRNCALNANNQQKPLLGRASKKLAPILDDGSQPTTHNLQRVGFFSGLSVPLVS